VNPVTSKHITGTRIFEQREAHQRVVIETVLPVGNVVSLVKSRPVTFSPSRDSGQVEYGAGIKIWVSAANVGRPAQLEPVTFTPVVGTGQV